MKQEKKDRKQVLAIVLLLSLFLNFSLLAFLIDTRHTWQQEEKRPTFQYGTYVDDLSGSMTRNTLFTTTQSLPRRSWHRERASF